MLNHFYTSKLIGHIESYSQSDKKQLSDNVNQNDNMQID